jgi:hypothetical protein
MSGSVLSVSSPASRSFRATSKTAAPSQCTERGSPVSGHLAPSLLHRAPVGERIARPSLATYISDVSRT